MHTGTVTYNAITTGLVIDEFITDIPNSKVTSLTCAISGDGNVKITIVLNGVYIEDWPILDIVQEVQQFIDVLSFEFDCPISSLRETDNSLKMKGGAGISQVINTSVAIWDRTSRTLHPGSESLEQFGQRYINHRQSSAIRMYSSAIQQEDPIARFMFLYNTLLTFSDDRQVETDKNILKIEPQTIVSSSPKMHDRNETIYTRLRNEIAHNREETDFTKIIEQVSQHVAMLAKITRQFIINNG